MKTHFAVLLGLSVALNVFLIITYIPIFNVFPKAATDIPSFKSRRCVAIMPQIQTDQIVGVNFSPYENDRMQLWQETWNFFARPTKWVRERPRIQSPYPLSALLAQLAQSHRTNYGAPTFLLLVRNFTDYRPIAKALSVGKILINEVENSEQLWERDLLVRRLREWFNGHGCSLREGGIVPRQFVPMLDEDCRELMAIAAKERKGMKSTSKWITKKVKNHAAHGMDLIADSVTEYVQNRKLDCSRPRTFKDEVVQEYLPPYLWDGYKWHLRSLLMIASTKPWMFFWRPSYASLSMIPYDPEVSLKQSPPMHLTNTMTQKTLGKGYNQTHHYRYWTEVFEMVERTRGVSKDQFWQDMRYQVGRISMVTLLSHLNVLKRNPGTYQMFALDLMLDASGQWHLLEANTQYGIYGVNKMYPTEFRNMYAEAVALIWEIQTGKYQVQNITYGEAAEPGASPEDRWELIWDERWGVDNVDIKFQPPPCAAGCTVPKFSGQCSPFGQQTPVC
eukprot:TRINITY_DN68311_c0_g1_i1.p1 TRINITY_DN68311_c0_g1~~TRINITY_DN68311_c0_g1_i1.p1  ORF type:complete len:504 (+),score=10.49 TRINITY_DN68311_c0_g1_i1:28-1539(+)